MINRIEIDNANTRRLCDSTDTGTMIGASAHGHTGNGYLSLDFTAQLNVTELAKLKALLDEVETRISGELGLKP